MHVVLYYNITLCQYCYRNKVTEHDMVQVTCRCILYLILLGIIKHVYFY